VILSDKLTCLTAACYVCVRIWHASVRLWEKHSVDVPYDLYQATGVAMHSSKRPVTLQGHGRQYSIAAHCMHALPERCKKIGHKHTVSLNILLQHLAIRNSTVQWMSSWFRNACLACGTVSNCMACMLGRQKGLEAAGCHRSNLKLTQAWLSVN
jgi:hypothetical protein